MIRFEELEDIKRYVQATETPTSVKKDCQNAHDFGGQDTVGLHVKRVNTSIEDSCEDAFGRYLGYLSTGVFAGGFAVFVTHIDYSPKAIEVFETLEELKQEWQLD